MDQTQTLLQSVVENARTGADACEQMLTRTRDAGMRQELMTQRDQYQAFARDAEKSLYEAGGQPHAKSPLSRMGMWMGVKMNTLTDASSAHIADIMIQGATMGVISMTRDRGDCPDADADSQGIASNFITCQQNSIERMKQFL